MINPIIRQYFSQTVSAIMKVLTLASTMVKILISLYANARSITRERTVLSVLTDLLKIKRLTSAVKSAAANL